MSSLFLAIPNVHWRKHVLHFGNNVVELLVVVSSSENDPAKEGKNELKDWHIRINVSRAEVLLSDRLWLSWRVSFAGIFSGFGPIYSAKNIELFPESPFCLSPLRPSQTR
jgi:hypothetical protein